DPESASEVERLRAEVAALMAQLQGSGEEWTRLRLSERDSARVLELLKNPPKPTKALLAAARRRAGK
ncbi:MAG TPA: DUF1778 domain-containing protein, partial [Thermoanaerobaculia bacterium]|nr:DUF1778 domain-containing protein [Thermoanaerobaculia bacterium]